MTILEQVSLFQRMMGSIKADIEEGKTLKAMGKMELLEGEMGVMRQMYEPQKSSSEEVENTEDIVEVGSSSDVVDTEDVVE